jgi:hypothetical protein
MMAENVLEGMLWECQQASPCFSSPLRKVVAIEALPPVYIGAQLLSSLRDGAEQLNGTLELSLPYQGVAESFDYAAMPGIHLISGLKIMSSSGEILP